MSVDKYVLYVCVVICYFFITSFTNGQVCTRRNVVQGTKYTTRFWTYRETYNGCISQYIRYGCKLTRVALKSSQIPITKNTIEIEEFCCMGYIRRESPANSSIVCEPICMPNCRNGYCKSPGLCDCNSGYALDPDNAHQCLPVCKNSCINGACSAPDFCLCNFGYNLQDGVCMPICTDTCINSVCSAPETCSCNEGYKKSDQNTICEPDCPEGCHNGVCKSPNNCTCGDGYELVKGTCVPTCTPSCQNGVCIAPDICQCNPPNIRNVSVDSDCDCTQDCTETTPFSDIIFSTVEYNDENATTVIINSSTEPSTDVETNHIFNANTSKLMDDNVIKEEGKPRGLEYWMIAASAVFLLVLIAASTVVVLKWKSIYIYCQGSSYVVEDYKDDEHSAISQFETVKFSAIQKP